MPLARATRPAQQCRPLIATYQVLHEVLYDRRLAFNATPILHGGSGRIWLNESQQRCVQTRCATALALTCVKAVEIDPDGAGALCSRISTLGTLKVDTCVTD